MTPARRSGSVSPGRRAALDALLAVESGAFAEEALARTAPERGSDRALAWNVVRGVLRQQRALDAMLGPLAHRPLHRLEPVVREVLRIGLWEILSHTAPPRAAVHEAVTLCREAGAPRAAGLVNAVLRRHAEAPTPSDRDALSHPDWILDRWEARYGSEATAAWARRSNEPAPLALVARDPRLPGALADAGLEVREARANGRAVPDVLWIGGAPGPVTELPGWREGWFWVQDPAAVAVADLVPVPAGLRVLDACAAPGGKAFRLAARGARVLAVDLDAHRLARVAEGATRLGLSVDLRVHDWEDGPPDDLVESFDAVLVDAPCSGLGTMRRHPEIRWRRSPEDLTRNAARQGAILRAAARCLARRGCLVYAVCSPEPEEGAEVVAAFLADHPFLAIEAAWTSAPPQDDEDAFQAVRMVRG
ncbi:MAG: methyltransferase domain-containing protein [Deltaproteobacteria bacterium]|nr:methyltransferase domain-containing protein [Deltaproteobacteria bacterium]